MLPPRLVEFDVTHYLGDAVIGDFAVLTRAMGVQPPGTRAMEQKANWVGGDMHKSEEALNLYNST